MNTEKIGRKANLEELRCLSMMMVVVLHFLSKGGLLGDTKAANMGAVGTVAWVLEAFCIVAVNVYMLISGYFLCESSFKLKRLLMLYLQVWMYSVGFGLVAVWFGIAPKEEINANYFLSLFFPISMRHYWFMTAYFFMYLIVPLVGRAVRNMTKKQLQITIIMLLSMFSIPKTVLPFRLQEDVGGYDGIWYLCVFLIAAYIRKFGISIMKKRFNCLLLYVGGCILILGEFGCLRHMYLKSGKFGSMLQITFHYNHLWVLIAAVGLFGLFLHGKGTGMIGTVASKVGPYVLGVYLLHENMGLRYSWYKWFGTEQIKTVPELLIKAVVAVVCVFIIGVIVEWIRSSFVNGLGKILDKSKMGNRLLERMRIEI